MKGLQGKDIVVIVIVICCTILLAMGINNLVSYILIAAASAYLGKEIIVDGRGRKKKP